MKNKKILSVILLILIAVLCFTACEKPEETYTVTFETFGGSKVENVKTNFLKNKPLPSKQGFYFVNWYTKPDFSSNEVIFPLKVKKDITLYAKFNEGIFDYTINDDNSVTITNLFYCPKDENIVFPSSIIKDNKTYKVKNIDIQNLTNNNNYIKSIAFESDIKIDNLVIPFTSVKNIYLSNITNINNVKINSCSSLETLLLPKNITNIPSNFLQGTSLKTLNIPSSVKIINTNSLNLNAYLETINFASDSKLETIKSKAFSSLYSLKQIKLPSTVKKIEKDAFFDCFNLESIVITSETTIELDDIYNTDKVKIYVKESLLDSYKTKYPKLSFEKII